MANHDNPFRPVKSMTAIVLTASMIASCGGGGGGGGGGGSVSVTTPPNTSGGGATTLRPPALPAISATEMRNTPSLASIGALAAHNERHTGAGITIGVADSGINAAHGELKGRVTGGGDWQGNNNGLVDGYGHGTNVAGIIAGADNGGGIQGVAPDAGIVSYRILNDRGDFGTAKANTMIPEMLADADGRDLPVVNMSWTSGYGTGDFGKAELDRLITGEIAAYGDFTKTGSVLVWAAGNDGDDEVSVRSGLPRHYPGFESGWLTVVAVDNNGRQTRYTNGCGAAAEWCLTAPGGGDSESAGGILTASADGGYEKRSGTSMAAPHVSGAMASVLDALPGIGAEGARARLLATAELDGLTTRDGCTVETCGEAVMRRAFGRGMVRVDRAIAPIAPEGIVTPSGRIASLDDSGIVTPSLAGNSIGEALAGSAAVIVDGFDGVHFATDATGFITAKDGAAMQGAKQESLVYDTATGKAGFMGEGHAPIEASHPARLIDIPDAPTADGWAGYRFNSGGRDARVAVGFGEARNAAHVMVSENNIESGSVNWFGGGIDATKGMLDGGGFGGFDFGGSESTWVFAGHQRQVGQGFLTMEGLLGHTGIDGSDTGLISGGGMVYDSFNMSFSSKQEAGKGWQVAIAVPPALRSGHITVSEARVDGAEGDLAFTDRKYDLRLSQHHREARLGVGYGGMIRNFAGISANLTHHHNAGHRPGRSGQSLDLSVEIKF